MFREMVAISSENYMKIHGPLKHALKLLVTYSLTPWSRVLLDNLTGFQLIKKFSAF